MKKLLPLLLVAAMVACPTNVFAAQNVVADANWVPGSGGAEFQADATLSVADAAAVDAAGGNSIWTTVGDGTGTVNFAGASNIAGKVGAGGAAIKAFNLVGAAGKTVQIGDDAFITTTSIANGGTLDLNGSLTGTAIDFGSDGFITLAGTKDLTASITNTNAGEGTLTLENGNHTITGDIGSTGTGLKLVTVGTGIVSSGNITAVTTNFAADGTLNIGDGSNITGAVTAVNGTGTLGFAGTSTVTGDVGTGAARLKALNTGGAAGKTVQIDGDVFAQTTTVNGTGTLDLNGSLSGTGTALTYGADGTVILADGKDITGNVDNSTGGDGAGTLNLEGTSTISGTVGATNTLKSISGGAAGKTVTFSSAAKSAALDVNGTGTVKLGNISTITTTTLSAAGTLDVDGGLIGNVNFGADGTIDLADTKNITGAIDNTTGADGVGTLNVEGTSTVSLEVGDTNSLKMITGGAAGKTVTFSRAVKSQALDVNGTGTVNLTKVSTIGTTTISAGGTLDLDQNLTGDINFTSDGTIALDAGKSITGNITNATSNQGTLTVEGASFLTGDIGSTGAGLKLITIGNAPVTTTGDIKATTINFAGDNWLKIADGKNVTGAITTSANNTGTLNYLGDSTTQANIAAAGNALKAVEVNGVLSLGHNIFATTTTVKAGGTLQATGDRTITGNVALAGTGILDAGANTLNITGTYDQVAGTTLRISVVDDVTGGSVVSAGAANVNAGSTVDVAVDGYVSDGTAYKVVDGTGGVVAVPTITDNSTVLSFAATTDGTDLTITASRTSSYEKLADTPNNEAVGEALEAAGQDSSSSNDMKSVLNEIDNLSSADAVNEALEQLTPDVNGASIDQSFKTLNVFLDTVSIRLSNARKGAVAGPTGMASGDFLNGIGMWAQGFGNHSNQAERGGLAGYKANVFGGAVGLDKLLGDVIRLGAAFSYARTDINSKSSFGTDTDINTYQSTLYASYEKGSFYVDGLVALAYGQYYGKRDIAFGGISRTAKGEYDGIQISTRIETGYTIEMEQLKRLQITPKMSLQYSHLYLDDYLETGANALNLKVKHQNYDALLMGIGGSFAYPIDTKIGTLIPEIHMLWYYDFMGEKQQSTSTFNGGGSSFGTNGVRPAQSSFNLGGQLTLVTKGPFQVAANYDMELKENFWGHSYFLTARVDF